MDYELKIIILKLYKLPNKYVQEYELKQNIFWFLGDIIK